MGVVEVEIGQETSDEDGARANFATDEDSPRRESRARNTGNAPEVDVEREVTKRQLITAISSVVVVILYMVFTLLRDREAGVVVVDPDDASDDWAE